MFALSCPYNTHNASAAHSIYSTQGAEIYNIQMTITPTNCLRVIVSILLYFNIFSFLHGFYSEAATFTHQTAFTTTFSLKHKLTKTTSSKIMSSSSPEIITTETTDFNQPVCLYHQVTIPTSQEGPPAQKISVEDLTPTLTSLLIKSQMKNGVVNIVSRHTTTAITINEKESRLAQDMEQYFLSLAPPDERSSSIAKQDGVRYYHNDIDQRPDSTEEAQRCIENGWDIHDENELQKWRDQEPINAHSHLLSMLLGSSESVPVVDGNMVIGQWQSVLLVDLDGPRDRTVGIQFMGYK
uniref:Secondary thiamine-phosphate synthase enzyme n=1 Tax=Ditylum brightwellii TaxID=49249 RepID=A0A7S1ZBE5_9STRA